MATSSVIPASDVQVSSISPDDVQVDNVAAPQSAQPEPATPRVTTSTNPKLNIAASGEDMPEYVGKVGAAGAGIMAGSALGEIPAVSDTLGLGKEYLEYYGKEGLQKIAEMAAQHPEATRHIARTLAGLLVGEGIGAGHAKSAALGLLMNLLK